MTKDKSFVGDLASSWMQSKLPHWSEVSNGPAVEPQD